MIASMCKGEVTVSQIETMELQIMKDLQWFLFPPTPMNFIDNLYPLLNASLSSEITTSSSTSRKRSRQEDDMDRDLQDSLDLSTFLVELSVCAYPFIMAKPSSIAWLLCCTALTSSISLKMFEEILRIYVHNMMWIWCGHDRSWDMWHIVGRSIPSCHATRRQRSIVPNDFWWRIGIRSMTTIGIQ